MELRFYCFVNYYLSSIQQGIQTGHAAVQLLRNYQCLSGERTPNVKLVESWADYHKTFVTLNGGNNTMIKASTDIIADSGYPFVTFFEDEQSLGGIQTCVGVVLPETIFKCKKVDGDNLCAYDYFRYTAEDGSHTNTFPSDGNGKFELIKLVTSAGLAK